MQQQPPTGIVVKSSFFPLSFFLFFCTPTIVINGQAYQKGWWSEHFIPLAPGRYNVKIFFKYLFMNECGANAIDINIAPGQVQKINFFMPPLMTAKGSITLA
jgi:hypothetical protein